MATPIKIGYWPIRGLVHFNIALLEYVGLPYTRVNYETDEQWALAKAELSQKGFEFPNLPYIEHNGEYHSESFAILAFIANFAKHHELLPTPEQQGRFFELFGVLADLNGIFTGPSYSSKTVEELKQRVVEAVAKNSSKLTAFNTILSKNKWLLGDQLTILDFRFADLVEKIFDMDNELQFGSFGLDLSSIKRYLEEFNALPAIHAFRASPKFIQRPWNGPSAVWK